MPKITVGFKTDVGRVRSLNQDSLAVLSAEELGGQAQGLFLVADGVGGNRRGGEVASRIAAQTVTEEIRAPLMAAPSLPLTSLQEIVHASLQAANAAVWQEGRRVQEQRGMGTTCVVALLRDADLVIGNVGDSRCYLLRDGRLEQITNDHAFLDMGRGSRGSEDMAGNRMHFRHVMTRAIGYASVVEPEVEAFRLRANDALLLCSDGLTKMLTPDEIAEIAVKSESVQAICDHLVAAANGKGGDDNITVIMARYGNAPIQPVAPLASDHPAREMKTHPAPNDAATPGRRSWRKRLLRLLKR